MADKEDKRLDETEAGGKFLTDDGKTFVNANGEPIKKGSASTSADDAQDAKPEGEKKAS
jgi:hypothetical protein